MAEGGLARLRAVKGGVGKPRAPEGRPESSGRCLDKNFQVEVFFCEISSFSVLRGRLEEEGEEKEEEEEKGEEKEEELQT